MTAHWQIAHIAAECHSPAPVSGTPSANSLIRHLSLCLWAPRERVCSLPPLAPSSSSEGRAAPQHSHCDPPPPHIQRLPPALPAGRQLGPRQPMWLFVHTSSRLPSPQLFPFSLNNHVRVRRTGQESGLSKGLFETVSESQALAAGPWALLLKPTSFPLDPDPGLAAVLPNTPLKSERDN